MAGVLEERDGEVRNTVAEPQLPLFQAMEKQAVDLSTVHTSKRGKRERMGVHRWHTYYAGYAEQFVVDVLAALGRPGDFVLDPWNGSGTTTLMAAYGGYEALGVEINPVMVWHAQAKAPELLPERGNVVAMAEAIATRARALVDEMQDRPNDELLEWVHLEPARALLALKRAILEQTVEISTPGYLKKVLHPSAGQRCFASKRRGFFLSALFQVLRDVGRFRKGSNPTWLVIDEEATTTQVDEVFRQFVTTAKRMLNDLIRSGRTTDVLGKVWTVPGDSRSMEIRDDTVDLVVTSPPYCTRIDYVVSTKPELLLMGYSADTVDDMRRENIGAPVVVDKEIAPRPEWGSVCNAFLEGVAHHQSKASQSYYLPLYLQYFRDAELSLREIKRVLKPGGKAAIVVQSSYYKELELPLGEIYVEMAAKVGTHAEIGRREVVRQHMAHINTKSNAYAKHKVYYEDVVYVENPGS